MTTPWRATATLLVASAFLIGVGPSSSAQPAPAPDAQLTALAHPGVTQRFAGGPMRPLGEPPNQAHTAGSTYRLLPVTLPGPDSSNQSARVRDDGLATLDPSN